MAANANMFLYWGSGSVPCWKPMLVLAEQGLWKGLQNKLVSFANKEHKSEEVTKINPRGQAPTFRDGEFVINESGAISLYLEEKYGSGDCRLLPSEPEQRSQVYQRMYETDNIQAKVMNIYYYKRSTKKEDIKEDYLKGLISAAEVEIAQWNGYLEGKDFLACGRFTLADCFFFPYLAILLRMGLKLEKSANLQRYYDNVSKRDSVQETWPPHWKEGPGPVMLDDVKA